MPNKVIFGFQDSSYGWTEVYYDTATNASLTETYGRAKKLATARIKMLASGGGSGCQGAPCTVPSLVLIRVSNTAQPRQSIFGTPNGVQFFVGANKSALPNIKTPAQGPASPDNPYSAIAMVLSLTNGAQSKRSISGVPDTFVCDQAVNKEDPWVSAVKDFLQVLCNGSWGALSTTKTVPPPAGSVIKTITQDTYGHPVITLTTGIAASCNQKLTVYNYVAIPGSPSINGVYRAVPGTVDESGNAVQWTLRKQFKPLVPFCLGNAIVYSSTVVPFASGTLTRPTKKSRGRPIALPRGRSRLRR